LEDALLAFLRAHIPEIGRVGLDPERALGAERDLVPVLDVRGRYRIDAARGHEPYAATLHAVLASAVEFTISVGNLDWFWRFARENRTSAEIL